MNKISAYYSEELGSWVRLVRECDGEFCHTSGYKSQEEALREEETKEKLV